MLPVSTRAADLVRLSKVLVVCTNRAWKNEAFLRHLVIASKVAQIKLAVLAEDTFVIPDHRLFQEIETSATRGSEFTPCDAITTIRTLFSEIAITFAPQSKDSKGSVLTARAVHIAERLESRHLAQLGRRSFSQEIKEDDEQISVETVRETASDVTPEPSVSSSVSVDC